MVKYQRIWGPLAFVGSWLFIRWLMDRWGIVAGAIWIAGSMTVMVVGSIVHLTRKSRRIRDD